MAYPALLRKADLDLIISTYEKGVIRQPQVNSGITLFRKQIDNQVGILKGLKSSGRYIPVNDLETDDASLENPESLVTALDGAKKNQKDEDFLQNCIPCDFRTIFKTDLDAFKDMAANFNASIDKIKKNFDKLDDLFRNTSDGDAFLESFCLLGNAFQRQCVPDLRKLLFVISFILDRTETGISIDTQVFSSALSLDLLGEIFSGALGLFDSIVELGIGPIKCVIESIRHLIEQTRQNTSAAQSAAFRIAERVTPNTVPNTSQNVASSARQQAAQKQIEQRERQMGEFTDKLLQETESVLELEVFTNYIKAGTDYIVAYKDYLLRIVQDILNSGTDSFNKVLGFNKKKIDLLKYISILRALIKAVQKGGVSCGPTASSMTEEEVLDVVDYFDSPDQNISLTIEDGNLVVRQRVPSLVQDRTIDGFYVPSISQASKPVDSCLGKVSNTDAAKVRQWIEELGNQ